MARVAVPGRRAERRRAAQSAIANKVITAMTAINDSSLCDMRMRNADCEFDCRLDSGLSVSSFIRIPHSHSALIICSSSRFLLNVFVFAARAARL
jgi:hypothetical protein